MIKDTFCDYVLRLPRSFSLHVNITALVLILQCLGLVLVVRTEGFIRKDSTQRLVRPWEGRRRRRGENEKDEF